MPADDYWDPDYGNIPEPAFMPTQHNPFTHMPVEHNPFAAVAGGNPIPVPVPVGAPGFPQANARDTQLPTIPISKKKRR